MYHPPARDGAWPELAGRYVAGDLESGGRPRDLLAALDETVEKRGENFRALFDRHDRDMTCALSARQVESFVRELLPETSAAEARYFAVVFDVDGDGAVTADEIRRVATEARPPRTGARTTAFAW